jgi:glyoxylase-like metal-dependent hydrolase (beta-lactamase superfamily II)
MKPLHRADLYGWSRFDETRNIDFHSVLWVRPEGNVVVDPLALSDHERSRLTQFGGAKHIVITNSDHVRDAAALREWTGARLYGPMGERATFPIVCDVWLGDGDRIVSGLTVLAMEGSKTPGELALLLEHTTLITGDLVRAHRAGNLEMLPEAKLADPRLALASLRRLANLLGVQTVLPGDGWPAFRDGHQLLSELHRQRKLSMSRE